MLFKTPFGTTKPYTRYQVLIAIIIINELIAVSKSNMMLLFSLFVPISNNFIKITYITME